jgi:hypothetical protein
MKQFDRHLAEQLKEERTPVIITAIIAVIFGAGILIAGWQTLAGASSDGAVEALKQMSYSDLRMRGLGAFADQAFIGLLLSLLGLAGVLCAVGQIRRLLQANRAIAQVEDGERPELVGISQLTWVGLLIASFVFPPLGIVLGIIFVLSKDESTRHLGSQMIKSAIAALVVIIGHLVWNWIADMASRSAPAPSGETAGE